MPRARKSPKKNYHHLMMKSRFRGDQGIMVRLGDKYSRACNLVRNQGKRTVKDETLEDTLLDLANYALLALLAYRRKKEAL